MKNLLMRILIAFVGIAIVAGAAYFYTKFQFNTVIVDNPTDAEISVKIDSGEEFKIAAKASVKQKIADGEHEVFVNGESVGKFDKKYSMDAALSYFGKSAILNPTLDYYVLEYIPYGGTTNLEDRLIEGQLYMAPEWNFGLDETTPDSITVRSRGGSKTIVKKKIWRIEDYAKEYPENFVDDEDSAE
jgi:hypothetical protein